MGYGIFTYSLEVKDNLKKNPQFSVIQIPHLQK